MLNYYPKLKFDVLLLIVIIYVLRVLHMFVYLHVAVDWEI